jgi:hypothetical protein
VTEIPISKTGVRVSDDFRDNLIIDRYDPVFVTMRASKLKHLRSENSEDAVTWNVFRSLRQIAPAAWLPELVRRGLPGTNILYADRAALSLWVSVNPPSSLLVDGDEGVSEIDIVIEGSSWVWFIEAKYRSDISTGTTTRPLRDQVLRNIDVGSYYAGVRDFFFTLLVDSAERSPFGAQMVSRYKDLTTPRSLLSGHRPDGLMNLKAVTLLTWSDLAAALTAASSSQRADERGYAERALSWMQAKSLVAASGS